MKKITPKLQALPENGKRKKKKLSKPFYEARMILILADKDIMKKKFQTNDYNISY